MSSYYDLLGISPLATEQDIRRAYRSKAKLYHPDLNASSDAQQKFIMLHKAYQTLMDRDKRYFYDNRLNGAFEQQRTNKNYSRYYNYTYYAEWLRVQKEKAEQEARLKQEEFIKNREKFRTSLLYYPSILFIYTATIICYLLGLGILGICGFCIYEIHFTLIFLLLPFICGGIYFIKCTGDWYKEAKKYF